MRLGPSLGVATSVVTTLVGLALVGSCGEGNPGIDPPADKMWFPSGVMLDPRVDPAATGPCVTHDDCGAGELCGGGGQCRASSRWLFVTNANSDRRFNAGSLMAIDLDAYWEAAFADPEAVRPAGAALSQDRPCRRLANLPQVVECMEEPFVEADATIHFGNFPGSATAWDRDPDDDEAMVLIPVRGDPSITYAELSGGSGGQPLRFECGQDSDTDGQRMCDDLHRLRFLRNDPDAARLAREPFRVLVSPQADLPLAYVSHQGDEDLTLIDLEGLRVGGDGRPAIVHQANILVYAPNPALPSVQGGFGLAQRPCEVDSGNAPTSTFECTRPLVYAAVRWQLQLEAFTAISHAPDPEDPSSQLECVGPDDLDKTGGVICEHQVEPLARIGLTGLSTFNIPLNSTRPILADIAFSRSGNQLYVLQSNPGGLIRVDTSLGFDGEPIDADVGVVEVCSQPTSFVIYDDGSNEYGIVTCYRSGEVFVVDLAALTVVGLSRAGIGPDAMTVDVAREVVYVANSLDATVSVIDMSRTRNSRFTEIGRIGLQEPYTQ
ncbi:MAG: hypothetical protein R6X02_07200 [Enhygromyxa sp.]